ncbi:MAG: hypothetical protein ACRDL7_03135, partial [Gaiellaceae bacterium]
MDPLDRLFPGPIWTEWRDMVHGSATDADAANWLMKHERADRNDRHAWFSPSISSGFFHSKAFALFRSGQWQLHAEIHKEEDVTLFFTPYCFIITLEGRAFPPKYPSHGIDIADARQVITNILWIFDIATQAPSTDRGAPSVAQSFVETTLIGDQLVEFRRVLEDRGLRRQWEGDGATQLRHTHVFFRHLGDLFAIFGTWMNFGEKIKLVYENGQPHPVRAADPISETRFGSRRALVTELERWNSTMTTVFRDGYEREPNLQNCNLKIPEFLCEGVLRHDMTQSDPKSGASAILPSYSRSTSRASPLQGEHTVM